MKEKLKLIPFLFLVFVTLWLRLVNLGYSDFQGDEIKALWRPAPGQSAIDFLYLQKKGPTEFLVTYLLKFVDPTFSNELLLRLPFAAGIQPNIVGDHGLTIQDAEVVVVLASLTHDLGMSIHRVDHEQYSLFIAQAKIREWLEGLYDTRAATIVRSEALHAIISHRSDGRPLTVEAGVVRVADALDMAKGRSRIPFEAGQVNIHSLSAAAIDKIEISAGEIKPIRIAVTMTNSAGIFQLDELLKEKLHGSGLEPYVQVEAKVEGEAEKKLIQVFRL